MNVLAEIMKEGVLVEPKTAEKILGMEEGEQAEIMERVRAEKPLILSDEFFENTVEVLEFREPKKTSIQESAAKTNSYFSALQNLFEKKSRAVSISNAYGSASVIGMVKNVLDDGFEIEDQTGAIKIASKAQVDDDDVVMVAGRVAGRTMYADSVEFPDLPERQAKKSPKRCEILFGRLAEGADYSISFGEKTEIARNSLVAGKTPVQVKINNILVLVLNNEKNIPPLQILKKRRLPGTLIPITETPDILLLRGTENVLENYKGATIIAVDKKSVARISLKTREVNFGGI